MGGVGWDSPGSLRHSCPCFIHSLSSGNCHHVLSAPFPPLLLPPSCPSSLPSFPKPKVPPHISPPPPPVPIAGQNHTNAPKCLYWALVSTPRHLGVSIISPDRSCGRLGRWEVAGVVGGHLQDRKLPHYCSSNTPVATWGRHLAAFSGTVPLFLATLQKSSKILRGSSRPSNDSKGH